MKKIMTKSLSLFLAVMMLLTCFAGIDVEAFASSSVKTKKIDGVTYSYTVSDSKVTITNIEPNKKSTVSIPSKISGNSVKTIKEYALCDYDETVKTVTIPNTVTKLCYSAFNGCSKLATINIGSGLKTIEKDAFSYCSSIKEFTVNKNNKNFSTYNKSLYNKSQTKIYKYTTGKTTKEVTLPKKVKTIGTGAFFDAQNVEKITLPSSVTAIYSNAFGYCTNLTSINIPSGVTSIGSNAFSSCYALESINLSKTKLTKLSNGIFEMSTSLKTIKLPSTIETIGSYAFNWTGITSYTATSKIKSIGEAAFAGCINLKTVDLSKSKITKLSKWLFDESTLSTLKLPSGITQICTGALSDTRIESFTVPSTVTSIGSYAFSWNDYLKSVDLSKCKITKISSSMFDYSSNLTTVKLPSKITEIGAYAFEETAIKDITIPSTVTKIGEYAFSGAPIESIKIPNSVTSIGSYAFADCTELSSITLSSKLGRIYEGTFSDCYSLQKLTVPASVTSIRSYAFEYSGLNQITIKGKDTIIYKQAFDNADSYSENTLVIKAPKDSKAEAFANKHSLVFKEI